MAALGDVKSIQVSPVDMNILEKVHYIPTDHNIAKVEVVEVGQGTEVEHGTMAKQMWKGYSHLVHLPERYRAQSLSWW